MFQIIFSEFLRNKTFENIELPSLQFDYVQNKCSLNLLKLFFGAFYPKKRLVHSLIARQQKKNSSNWELLLISHSKEGNNLLLFYGTLFSLIFICVNFDGFYILRGSSCNERRQ